MISPNFQKRFCIPTTIINMNSLIGLTKWKHFKSKVYRNAKTRSAINNASIVYHAINKGLCMSVECEISHKYRGCTSRNPGLKAIKRNAGGINSLQNMWVDDGKIVHIAISIRINDNLFWLKFINTFLYLLKFLRLKITNCF